MERFSLRSISKLCLSFGDFMFLKCHSQMFNAPTSTTPVVRSKEAETLNSILRKCGLSIDLNAVDNKNLMGADILFTCQPLKFPAFASPDNQLIKKTCFHRHQKERPGSAGMFDGCSKEKPFIMLSAHALPHAKPNGYFLLLVPLIAFCVTSIIGAFHTRRPKDKGSEDFDESWRRHNRPRSIRWKHALSDIDEPDNLDSDNTPENQDQSAYEDMSDAYSKAEHDYQKFLSECGVSKWGYWRGGFHER